MRFVCAILFCVWVSLTTTISGQGTQAGSDRFNVEYSPMSCTTKKQVGKRYKGLAGPSGNWFDSEDICVSVCWQYSSQGYPCKSVNYVAATKTCELMQDSFGQNPALPLSEDSSSNYLVVQECRPLGSNPAPATTPKPDDTNTNTNVNTGSVGGTGSIRPGSCGQTSVPNKVNRAYLQNRALGHRIVGGFEARPNSVPWIVSLRKWNWHSCGGTLIRVNDQKDESDIVVTAAHCLTPGDTSFEIVAGAHYTNREQSGEVKVPVSQTVIHPGYKQPGQQGNDIAIIKLSRPIKFSNTIQPACLPSANDIPPYGTNGIVAGWGGLQENKGGPEALHQVVVPTISPEKCRTMYGNVDAKNELCAGYDQGKKDACQGDSGGPYVLEGKNGFTLHGVVSWGAGCARARAPGVYARVTTYLDWINEQVRALSSIRG